MDRPCSPARLNSTDTPAAAGAASTPASASAAGCRRRRGEGGVQKLGGWGEGDGQSFRPTRPTGPARGRAGQSHQIAPEPAKTQEAPSPPRPLPWCSAPQAVAAPHREQHVLVRKGGPRRPVPRGRVEAHDVAPQQVALAPRGVDLVYVNVGQDTDGGEAWGRGLGWREGGKGGHRRVRIKGVGRRERVCILQQAVGAGGRRTLKACRLGEVWQCGGC